MTVINLIQKLRDFIATNYHRLIHLRDTPHSIAGGVAVGIFVGFTPLFIPFVPLKSFLSFGLSWLFRCSKTAAVIAVTAHDVIFPIWPLVLLWEYRIGFWLLHHQMPSQIHIERHHIDVNFQHWFSMDTFHTWSDWIHDRFSWVSLEKVLVPTLIGSILIGIPMAAISYAIAMKIVRQYQETLLKKTESLS